jgi:protocatechuate 3,4-dioxygenase beta subunit
VRNAWFFRSLAVLALVAFVAAIALSRWAREQPLPLPPEPAGPDDDRQPRQTRVPRLPDLVGQGAAPLDGTVVDYAGGAVREVVVTAYEDGPIEVDAQPVARASTDADGAFALRGLAEGTYRLSVDGPQVFASDVRFVDVPGRSVRLTVARRVGVAGVVTHGGQPAPGVTVALSGGGIAGVTTRQTGDGGRFEVADLMEGEYRVWAYAGDRAARAVIVARLGAGPFESVALAMESAAIVRGRVVDGATGRGLQADVMLSDSAGVEPARYGHSDDDGAFTVEGVPHGSWIPDANADGYVATEMLAFETQRVDSIVIRLVGGGIARGRVVDGAGVAIRGVAVSLHGEDLGGQPVVASATSRRSRTLRLRGEGTAVDGARFVLRGELGVVLGPIPYPPPPGARTARPAAPAIEPIEPIEPASGEFRTDVDGRFRITGLRPGRYVARFAHPDYAPGSSAEFSVQLGDDGRSLTTRLVPGLVVFGAVRDSRGASIAGATVSAEAGEQGAPLAIAVTGVDGRYQLQPLARNVTLRVTAAGFGAATRAVTAGKLGRERVRREQSFELVSADATVRGRVFDPRGNPLSEAVVVARGRNVVTDGGGRFAVEGVAPGEHELVVSHADYPSLTVKVSTNAERDLKLEQGGGVRFDVRDRHTTGGISAGRLTLAGPGGEARKLELSDGAAVLAPIRKGRWTVRVAADGYVPLSMSMDVPAGDGPRAISIRSLRIDMERGATIGGTVRDRHGERVAGALVTAGDASVKTDRDGNFRLDDVVTGDVEIRASRGQDEGSTRAALRPGDELVTLEIRLD